MKKIKKIALSLTISYLLIAMCIGIDNANMIVKAIIDGFKLLF